MAYGTQSIQWSALMPRMAQVTSRRKRSAGIAADSLLKILAPILLSGRIPNPRPPHPRVLVIRCDHIGDAAMATAVLEPIRQALGASRLDVLAAPWAVSIFEGNPTVDEVLTVETPWWLATKGVGRGKRLQAWRPMVSVIKEIQERNYDIGIDLRGDLRQILFFLVFGRCKERISSDRTGGTRLLTGATRHNAAGHEVEMNLAVAKLLGVDEASAALDPPPLPEPPAVAVDEITRVARSRGYITLSVRGTARSKGWPASNAAAFIEMVAELGFGTVYVGGQEDRGIAEEISKLSRVPIAHLAGELSIPESLSVIAGAKATVSVDSGPMHLAALVGTPVVGLFGPTDPRHFGPWTNRREIVSAVTPPCGCVQPSCAVTSTGPGACMASIDAKDVLDALDRLLRNSGTLAP
jgi:heptosyltransferase-1